MKLNQYQRAKLNKVLIDLLARKIIEAPRPPFPPLGPPLATYFSWRKAIIPSPPLPERTSTTTLSINIHIHYIREAIKKTTLICGLITIFLIILRRQKREFLFFRVFRI